MIKVYHGSTAEIRKPDVTHGRDNLDFGKAFYLTRLKSQAEHWARVVYSRYEQDAPVVRLQYHKPNNQIAILNQEIVNRFLVFETAEQISANE